MAKAKIIKKSFGQGIKAYRGKEKLVSRSWPMKADIPPNFWKKWKKMKSRRR